MRSPVGSIPERKVALPAVREEASISTRGLSSTSWSVFDLEILSGVYEYWVSELLELAGIHPGSSAGGASRNTTGISLVTRTYEIDTEQTYYQSRL